MEIRKGTFLKKCNDNKECTHLANFEFVFIQNNKEFKIYVCENHAEELKNKLVKHFVPKGIKNIYMNNRKID